MKKTLALALLASFAVSNSNLAAQDVVESKQEIVVEANQESGGIIMMRSEDGENSDVQVMSFDSSATMPAGPFMPGMFGGDSFDLLNHPGVQKDLELIDDQLDRIKEINKDFGNKISEKIKMMRGENGSIQIDGAASIGALIQDLKAQQKAEIEGLLLPQQQARLKQVKLQMQMQNRGTANTLDQLAKELNITGDQKKRIKARQKELKKEFEEKLAKLKEDSRKALLDELTDQQKTKFKEMVGEQYKFEKERRFQFPMRGAQKRDF